MSTHVEQQQDTRSSMLSDEMRPEEVQIAEELKIKAAQEEHRLNEITHLNATTSPLLLLPAEIRNMIYELALDYKKDICIFSGSAQTDYRHPINLLSVCRQTQAETALLPYGLNLFRIYDTFPLQFLRRRTPAQIEAMTKVMVFYGANEQKSATEWMKTLLKAL